MGANNTLPAGIDNPEIQRRINKLNQDWDELCDLAESKRDQTNNAMVQMEAFDVSYHTGDTPWICV